MRPSLDYPNICTIYEINETRDGQVFIAMGYYEGETLEGAWDQALEPWARRSGPEPASMGR